MSQEVLGDGAGEGAEERQAEREDRNYKRDVIMFLYKPVEWGGEEEKISRARRYRGLVETLENDDMLLPIIVTFEEMIKIADRTKVQGFRIHQLRNLNDFLLDFAEEETGLTVEFARKIKLIITKNQISFDDFAEIKIFYQKIEQLFGWLEDKPELAVAIFKQESYLEYLKS